MSVGHARVAIRRMLRVRHPRRFALWQWCTVGGVAAAGGAGAVLSGTLDLALVGGVLAILAFITLVLMLLGRLVGWIVMLALFGLGLGLIPLFGVIGYELAVATAFLAAFMGADLGVALAREMQRLPAPALLRANWPGRTLARGVVAAGALAAAVVLIPAAISAVRGLWLPTCDWGFGLAAYAALPLATAALAGMMGHAIGVLAGGRRVIAPLLAHLVLVGVALAALWRFYSEPPVYSYNAILGYFPGNLYDEHVRLHAALGWSRLEQLLWVIALVAFVAVWLDVPSYRARLGARRPAGGRQRALLLAIAAAGGGFALHVQSGRLGYAIDAEDIQVALGGRLETEHFIIHYARTPELEDEMPLIARDHELRYAQVVAVVGAAPARKLRSYYFADRDHKWRLFGAKDVEMAKPWLGDIYLDHRSFPHTSLRHEIAHAIAREFGDPIFHVASQRVLGLPLLASPGLIEGLAVAVDWPSGYDRPNPHEAVRAMQEMGELPRLRTLFGLQFFSVSSARGYTTAGSFVRFLLDRYGAARVRALYGNGGDFEAAYGMRLEALEAEWVQMLSTIVLPKAAVEASAERFRGTSVFARPCPHAIAARREAAFRSLGRGDRRGAVALMRRVCSDAPEEPRHKLELGDFLFSGGDAERGEGEALWSSLATNVERVTSSLRAQAYERLVRAAGSRGEFDNARELLAAALALPVDPNERRVLDGMAFALAHDGPAATALRGYFFPQGTGPTPLQRALDAVTAEPELGLGHYLVGLQHQISGNWTASAAALELALGRGLPNLAFTKNAARRLALAAYRAGDRARLGVAITVLSGSPMTSGDRLLARDWLDRMTFDVTGRLAR
jgi:hypothetical protein